MKRCFIAAAMSLIWRLVIEQAEHHGMSWHSEDKLNSPNLLNAARRRVLFCYCSSTSKVLISALLWDEYFLISFMQ